MWSRSDHSGILGFDAEVFGRLVPLPVFNTGVARNPGQAGSIPVRLRQTLTVDTRRGARSIVRPRLAADASRRRGRWSGVTDPRREVPRTDAVLADPRLRAAAATLGRSTVKAAVVAAQERARRGEIAAGAGGRRRGRRAARARGEPAAGAQRHRRRRAHEPGPGTAFGRRGRGRRRRGRIHRRRTRPRHRAPGPARARRARGARGRGSGRRRGPCGQQRRGRAFACGNGIGDGTRDRRQPRRDGRDR